MHGYRACYQSCFRAQQPHQLRLARWVPKRMVIASTGPSSPLHVIDALRVVLVDLRPVPDAAPVSAALASGHSAGVQPASQPGIHQWECGAWRVADMRGSRLQGRPCHHSSACIRCQMLTPPLILVPRLLVPLVCNRRMCTCTRSRCGPPQSRCWAWGRRRSARQPPAPPWLPLWPGAWRLVRLPSWRRPLSPPCRHHPAAWQHPLLPPCHHPPAALHRPRLLHCRSPHLLIGAVSGSR